MGDIICRVCGEPWDSYGVYHGDMTPTEKARFLQGKGCPCCFGKGIKKTDVTEKAFLLTLTTETDDDPIKLLQNIKP